MVIRIKTKGKKIFLPIPSNWVFSRIGLHFLKKNDNDGDFANLSPKHMRNIRKTIRKMRRKHKNWNIVEVNSSDGTYVRIKL